MKFKTQVEEYNIYDQKTYNQRVKSNILKLKNTKNLKEFETKLPTDKTEEDILLEKNFKQLTVILGKCAFIDKSIQEAEIEEEYKNIFDSLSSEEKNTVYDQIQECSKKYISSITEYKHKIIMQLFNIQNYIEAIENDCVKSQCNKLLQKFFQFESICSKSLQAAKISFDFNCISYILGQKIIL